MTTQVQPRAVVQAPAALDPGEGPVLIVRLGAIGDVVRGLPALDLLRRAHPDLVVDWVVEEKAADVLKGHPHLRKVILFRRRELVREAKGLRLLAAADRLRDTARRLARGGYAAAVDLQGSLKSALMTRATGSRRRIGLIAGHGREGSHLFYTHPVNPGPDRISRVERNFRLIEALGIPPPEPEHPPLAHLQPPTTAEAWADGVVASLAPSKGPRVLLYPGTSRRQAYKRWEPARFGWLAGRLHDDGVQVLVAGGPGEEAILDEVLGATSTPPAVLPPSSLMQLTALIARMDLFVGGDTGPMHLAWAVGTPVLALFGATDPIVNAPYDAEHLGHRVLYHGPPERPYRVTGAGARAWMDAITVDEVYANCREMLGR
ncbi:MAG: glycosyltransferase family 9 protein [Acidobacteriota bacterium]